MQQIKTLAGLGVLLAFLIFPQARGQAATISLSSYDVSLNRGSTASVAIFSDSGQSFYIAGNSDSSVVSAGISGNVLTLYGVNAGTSRISVCTTDNQACTNLMAEVYASTTGSIVFNPSSVTLNVGQSASVGVYGGSGTGYFISSNTNPSVAQASISGNTLTVYGISAGSASIAVCSSSGTYCGSLPVQVNTQAIGGITLSQNYLNLNIGQSSAVTVSYGGAYPNNFYVSGNTNSSVAQASITGSSLYVTALAAGTTTVSVSAITGTFGTANLYVTVNPGWHGNPYFADVNPVQARLWNQYSYNFRVLGGNPPYTFTLYSGNIPAGLYLAGNGLLYGIPTAAGTYNFTVRAADMAGASVVSNNIQMYVSGSVSGATAYANGTLVNDHGTIYIVYKNMKSGFATMNAFRNLGYRLSGVVTGSTYSLQNSNYVITQGTGAHPWGTWIITGGTVYFVHDSGLIPVSAYDIFLNNGGLPSMLVPANIQDFSKPIQPIMVYGDARLK